MRTTAILCLLAMLAGGWLVWNRVSGSAADRDASVAAPSLIEPAPESQLTMADVLQMAQDARQHMSDNLDDYTARFVKRETDDKGVLGPESELFMKVQTKLRGETEDAPKRVFLKFLAPDSLKGRKVIWGEDLYEGKMAVHEVGMILGLKTIWLDPTGIVAMNGQRYPISEIGMVRLVEKLIERGEKDRDNPDISVQLRENHRFGDVETQLIQVRRAKPSEAEDDFSLAEIVIDPQRQLVLQYRSFGWPEQTGEEAPLVESYTYHDVQTNVGLTDEDFNYRNPEYGYPAF